jgi:hypothetical protein
MFGYAEYVYIYLYIYIYVFTGIFPFLSSPIFYTRDQFSRAHLSLPLPLPLSLSLFPSAQSAGGSCYAQSGKNLPSIRWWHRIASHCNASQSLQTRPPSQTIPNQNLFIQHPATRRRPPFSFPSQSSPTSSNPRESAPSTPSFVFVSLLCPHLINHIPSTVIWIACIKTNSIALDVHVPSWSTNRINHPRVVSLVQPAADFTLPIAEVLQSSRLL